MYENARVVTYEVVAGGRRFDAAVNQTTGRPEIDGSATLAILLDASLVRPAGPAAPAAAAKARWTIFTGADGKRITIKATCDACGVTQHDGTDLSRLHGFKPKEFLHGPPCQCGPERVPPELLTQYVLRVNDEGNLDPEVARARLEDEMERLAHPEAFVGGERKRTW